MHHFPCTFHEGYTPSISWGELIQPHSNFVSLVFVLDDANILVNDTTSPNIERTVTFQSSYSMSDPWMMDKMTEHVTTPTTGEVPKADADTTATVKGPPPSRQLFDLTSEEHYDSPLFSDKSMTMSSDSTFGTIDSETRFALGGSGEMSSQSVSMSMPQ